MITYVGLLRAVNLGGSTQLRMAALREMLATEGLEDVRTLLQSGNVIFKSTSEDSARLEETLAGALLLQLHLSTDVFLRTAKEWRTLLDGNPFRHEANDDPAHLVLTALKGIPHPEAWTALRGAIRGPERVQPAGRNAYMVFPDGIGRSKLTAAVIERTLGMRSTSRNWNTVRKLDQLASA